MNQVELPLALLGLESLLPAHQRGQHDLGAIAADGFELAHGRVFPDDHHAGDLKQLGRVRQPETGVAGRQRDDALPTLLRTELQKGIDGAPYFEGAGSLQVLGLQPGAGTRNRPAGQRRGLHHIGLNPVGGGSDVRKGEQLSFDRHA